MLSSLLNANSVAPKVTPRPSASPKKQNVNVVNSERPGDDDDDVVFIQVSHSIFSSFFIIWETPQSLSLRLLIHLCPHGTMTNSDEDMSDLEFLAHLKSSTPAVDDITPKPSPRNPMSISSILPSANIIPDTSPLSTIAPATSPPSPRRPNPTSSQVVSDDVDMIDPSGDNGEGLDIEGNEQGEEGDMDEDDEVEGEGEGEGDEDDDSEDDEDSEDDDEDDDAEVGFSSFFKALADL